MKKSLLVLLTACSSILLVACGDSSEPAAEKQQKPHVWTSQTDTIQTAKDTAADLEKTLQSRQEKIDNQ